MRRKRHIQYEGKWWLDPPDPGYGGNRQWCRMGIVRTRRSNWARVVFGGPVVPA